MKLFKSYLVQRKALNSLHTLLKLCIFLSFKEVVLADIWYWFCVAVFKKVKRIWELCSMFPSKTLLSFTSLLKTSYSFVSFCAWELCLLWCHSLLILKEGREQRWHKLLIFWIRQMFSGLWEFKAPILKCERCSRGDSELLDAVTCSILVARELVHHSVLNVASACWVQWSSPRSIAFPEYYKRNWPV